MIGIPYVVLVGNVGVGKSTLVEKAFKKAGLASDSADAVTQISTVYTAEDNSIAVADCPGTNSTTDTWNHNIAVAQAVGNHPVSLLLVVVKADTRTDNVIKDVREYLPRFVEFSSVLGVCVTHMSHKDTPGFKWTPPEFEAQLKKKCDIDKVMYMSSETTQAEIIQNMKSLVLPEGVKIDVNSQNFLEYFPIPSNGVQILSKINKIVAVYRTIWQNFKMQHPSYDEDERADLIFAFHAWMNDHR